MDVAESIAGYIAELELDGKRLAGAAAAAGPDAPVPTCPEWAVRDLVRHTGGVHRWATSIVATPRVEPWNVDLPDVVGTWPDDEDLVDWFRHGHAALVAALSSADPDLACWTFLRAPTPLTMWSRRQAHETAIHRVDAERAAGGPVTPSPARFAADGVDELLTCFITRRTGRLRSDTPRTLAVGTTDTSHRWVVRISDGRVVTERSEDPDGATDCAISGPAADLYLALWNRGDPAALTVAGDPDVLALFLDRVQVTWS